MKECAKQYLQKRGYLVNEEAQSVIELCEAWYAGRIQEDFHTRRNLNNQSYELARLNMAKRCCSDDANLCEILSVAPVQTVAGEKFIMSLIRKNNFNVRYREQLEKTAAAGTAGAYIYLQNASYVKKRDGAITVTGGEIRINYVEADCIIPLTVENRHVTECAFCGTNKVKGKEKTTLVIFTKASPSIGAPELYQAETVVFNWQGVQIKEDCSVVQLGEVKPFAILQNAEVNSIDHMEGYGMPKIYNAIPVLKIIDLCYNVLFSDLDKAEKIVLINELLCEVRSKDGKPELTPQQKKLFVLLGEKLPNADSLIKEYNPEIRIEQITKAFELALSLLSLSFGYGTKKYTFENGRVTTATEYIGTRQDSMQELNKQRQQAKEYISDIVHAAMWFSNQFQKTAFDVTEPLNIEFDDSYVEDRQSKLQMLRDDALSFDIPELTVKYLQEAYNMPEEAAKALVFAKQAKEESDTDGDEMD